MILLRFAGQRTLAKWYAFDLIVTVALGSTFANTVLTNSITVSQSLVGFVILVGLQFITAFVVVRWSYFRVIVNPRPTLVLHCGKFIHEVAAQALFFRKILSIALPLASSSISLSK